MWTLNEHYSSVKSDDWVQRTASVNYLVVAGGGSGGNSCGPAGGGQGGGGAGGYRASGFGPSPLQGSALTLGLGEYSITIGGGGATNSNPGSCGTRVPGNASTFSTITSAGSEGS